MLYNKPPKIDKTCAMHFTFKTGNEEYEDYDSDVRLIRNGDDWYTNLDVCLCDEDKYSQISDVVVDDQQGEWLETIKSFANPHPHGTKRLQYKYLEMSLHCALSSGTLYTCRCARVVVAHQLQQLICSHINSSLEKKHFMNIFLPHQLDEFRKTNEAFFEKNSKIESLFKVYTSVQKLALENIDETVLRGDTDGLISLFKKIIADFGAYSCVESQKDSYNLHLMECEYSVHVDDIYFEDYKLCINK